MSTSNDSNCANIYSEDVYVGTYILGDEITLDDDNKVHKMNATKVTNTQTILTDAAISFYNSNSVCGKTDWVKDVEADLTVCNSANLGERFDIVDIEDNKLYFGSTHSNTGDADGNRYTTLDTTEEYIKQ